ncbi:hypothetical protein G5714_019407 [Onychostoma macrolepis]|uniref:Uncharacterized protein n=1 Tax=Onychostoma macrolepis TaxID=369639 RepID=A0A7J6BWZ4_9TELE|nr:hypothetical protein G5714_019407 [Onychostoma macrolepis]
MAHCRLCKGENWRSLAPIIPQISKQLHVDEWVPPVTFCLTSPGSALWDSDVLSLESSDPTLLGSSSRSDENEEVDVVGDDDESMSTESSLAIPSCAYGDMLDVMGRASEWLGVISLGLRLVDEIRSPALLTTPLLPLGDGEESLPLTMEETISGM